VLGVGVKDIGVSDMLLFLPISYFLQKLVIRVPITGNKTETTANKHVSQDWRYRLYSIKCPCRFCYFSAPGCGFARK